MRRLLFFVSLLLLALSATDTRASEPAAVSGKRTHFEDVANLARELSTHPFETDKNVLPESLQKIGYDEWRDIRFSPAKSLWQPDLFSVQFFHPGFLYKQPVRIHYVDKAGTHLLPFSTDLFSYAGKGPHEKLTGDFGFAGLRIHYPLNTPKYADELISFLGASYFRALGKDLLYGLSARGVAVNTAEADGEEFPAFKEFWILHPNTGFKEITLYALLDSPSLTGAYEFIVTPGQETTVAIRMTLFIRKAIAKLGIAPLTSMFFNAEDSGLKGSADFRPEIHDSDGFLHETASGEWVWHPLVNPERLLINSFGGDQPLGFGLIQRDTNFDHYQDLEARYDRRPSLWVTPKGNWGNGRLELVQIPTPNEYNDNIVAYWVPEKKPQPGDSLQYAYTLIWHSARFRFPPLGYVDATRLVKKDNELTFMVDFSGDMKTQPPGQELTADVQVSGGGTLKKSQIIHNAVTGGERLVIQVVCTKPGLLQDVLQQEPPVELRAFLKDKTRSVTETWSYTFQP